MPRTWGLVLAVASALAPRPAFSQAFSRHERGAALYGMMCSVCHGPAGEGYKADRAPALANPDFLASASDDFIRRAIAEGRAGTTMSAWSAGLGGPLTPEDLDDLVAFIRGWQSEPSVRLDERPAEGDAAGGGRLFASECAKCHGTNGRGGDYVNVGNREFLKSASNGYLRYAIREGRRYTLMADYGVALAEGGTEDLLAFFRSLAPQESGPSASAPLANVGAIPLGPVPLNPGGPEPEGFKTYPGLTPADVIMRELDRGAKLALLDARAPADYLNDHIAGAVSVPFYDPLPYLAGLPKDAWLVCYCSCPHAESGQLARKLQDAGFSKVTVLDEGFGVWKQRGYPSRRGRNP